MYRHRFKTGILAEFLPPAKPTKIAKVIIYYDGMPSAPNRQALMEFLSKKGYWAIYPRYRGAWESEGVFLDEAPENDVSAIISELPDGLVDAASGRKFELSPDRIIVVGGSFGGTTALMASLDWRVDRAIANCPVVDWRDKAAIDAKETSNPNYAAYIREAFGPAYRLSDKNWAKLGNGPFFNPSGRLKEFDPAKVLMFHAKDDELIPWREVAAFSRKTGIKLLLSARGGHGGTGRILMRRWKLVKKFIG